MTGTAIPIVQARRSDLPAVAALVAESFHPLAVSGWLVPDGPERARLFPRYFQIFVEHAADNGFVYITEDRTGAAVWFDHTAPLPDIADYDACLHAATGSHLARFRVLDKEFEARHPDGPHHYLAFLAVLRHGQNRGVGSALLDHHHAILDESGTAGYLEASSPDSRRLYAKKGYTDHGPTIDLPGGQAQMWPMWRPAQVDEPDVRFPR
jgi:ribosomal protein S18 acetylase RimI-like enzyme